MVAIANEEVYGPALYVVLPNMAPENGTKLEELQAKLPSIEQGLGRTAHEQALMQLASLGVTLAIAVVGGLITGYIIHIDCIFNILKDTELFEDKFFFVIEDDEETEESSVSSSINVTTVDGTEDGIYNQPSEIPLFPCKQEILNGEYVNRFDPNNMYSGSYHPGMQITRRNTIGAPQQDQHHPHVVDDNGQSHHNAVVDNLSYFA